jgi:NADH-quinone oxidoreductase subunit E
MSVRRLAPPELQPKEFAFSADNLAWAKKQTAKYPEGRQASAVIPVLWRAQEQAGGWLPQAAIEYVADFLGMAKIRVLEVATFYTMFLLSPVGKKAHVQVCGTTPCMLRGAGEIRKVCERRIHHEPFHVSADGNFSWEEVECLGACVNAPMVLIWNDTYEDLTPESFEKVLDGFLDGKPVKPGPQIDRQLSAPVGGPTTLTDPSIYQRRADGPGGRGVDDASAKKPTPDANEREAPAPTHAIAREAAKDGVAPPESGAAALAHAEEAEITAKLATLPKTATAEEKANAVGTRPAGLAAARSGKADDLKRIRGIGPVNEGRLNALGVFHFDQIAAWAREEIRWVGTYLSFPGRIDREDWVGQAKVLAQGGDTEFSKRVDRGEVPTSSNPQGKA